MVSRENLNLKFRFDPLGAILFFGGAIGQRVHFFVESEPLLLLAGVKSGKITT